MQNLQIYRGTDSVPLTKYKYKATRSFRDLPDSCRKRRGRRTPGDLGEARKAGEGSYRRTSREPREGRRRLLPENVSGSTQRPAKASPGERLGNHAMAGEGFSRRTSRRSSAVWW